MLSSVAQLLTETKHIARRRQLALSQHLDRHVTNRAEVVRRCRRTRLAGVSTSIRVAGVSVGIDGVGGGALDGGETKVDQLGSVAPRVSGRGGQEDVTGVQVT